MITRLTARLPITRGAFGLMLLSVPLLVLALFSAILLQHRTAHADVTRGYESHLWMKCYNTNVEEGDTFRLEVLRSGNSDSTSPTMRVYWYTEPGTADESDYRPFHRERQASNGYQSRIGVMGRTFHTKEDNLHENNETFTVRFENSVKGGDDASCSIQIIDDD